MFPDWSDWYARKPSGTTKNTDRNSTPGRSSRYGVAPWWRWKTFTRRPSPGDQVLPLRQVLLVVERRVVEDLDLRERLRAREDQRVVGDRRVELQCPRLRPDHGRDVVDARDVPLRVAGLHQALHLRVVHVVHVDRRRVDVAALRDQHVVRPEGATLRRHVPVDVLVADLRDVARPRHRRGEVALRERRRVVVAGELADLLVVDRLLDPVEGGAPRLVG